MWRAGWRSARCRSPLPLLPLLLLLVPVTADVIFRVPEVLVRHAAAPKPVGTGRSNYSRINDSEQWAAEDTLLELRYEEYFVEHDVSTADARKAARTLNVEDVPATRPGCGACSARDEAYCESRVLADHCCCERRFVAEPFPWLPHTCYVGARRCRPAAHDCAQYARLRNCCCYRKLAERWKSILSQSPPQRACSTALLLGALLLAVRV